MSSLIQWRPFGHVSPVARRQPYFTRRAFAPIVWTGERREPSFGPNSSFGLNIEERDDAYLVTAAVPGIAPDDVTVEVKDRTLTISGETKSENEGDGNAERSRRRGFGSIHRSLSVPEGTSADSITADYENGVLTVTVPKPEPVQAKVIPVIAAGEPKARKAKGVKKAA